MGSGESRDDAGSAETLATPSGTEATLASGSDATARTLASGGDATARTLASAEPRGAAGPLGALPRSVEDLPFVAPGRYEILRAVGQGGLGRILEARDRLTGRLVAIKELRPDVGGDGADAVERLAREAMITANLEHPAIVPVHEVARWASGQPFYVMKLVRGRSLADVVAGATTLEARLALVPHVVQVAEALAYAHAQGWMHRDLKPANVLVGSFGETVVIDWGLARPLDGDRPVAITLPPAESVPGQIVGTPVYMSPEQARGNPVDARTDVYSVGAMLYHVLAGVPPYHEQKSAVAVIDQVARKGPPRPLGELALGVPRDLLAIVERAMARDANQRYRTAGELAADLERFHTGALVAAHDYTRWERIRRFARRNRAAVAVAALAFTALAVIGTIAVVRIVRAERAAQRDRVAAEAARDQAEARRTEAVQRLSAQYRELGRTQLVNRSVGRALPYLAAALRGAPDDPVLRTLVGRAAWSSRPARLAVDFAAPGTRSAATARDGTAIVSHASGTEHWDLKTVTRLARYPAGGGALTEDGALIAVWDEAEQRDVVHVTATRTVRGKVDPGGALAAHGFGDGGATLWTATRDGELRFWATADLRLAAAVVIPGRPALVGALVDDAGASWAAAAVDGRVWLGDRRGIRHALGDPRSGKVYLMSFATGGRYLIGVSWDDSVWVWDVATGRQTARIPAGGSVVTIATSTTPPLLLVSVPSALPTLYELPGGKKLRTFPAPDVGVARIDETSRRVLTGDGNGRVALFDVATGIELGRLGGHPRGVVAIDRIDYRDGYATLASDGSLRMWDVATTDATIISRHPDRVWNGRFLDDSTVVTVGADGLGRIVGVDGTEHAVLSKHDDQATWVAVAHDGQRIATSGRDGTARIWTRAGAPVATLTGHTAKVRSVELSPADPDQAVTASADKTIRIWRISDGATVHQIELAAPAMSARYSPDGKVVAITGEAPELVLADAATGAVTARVTVRGQAMVESVFSPDGELVAAVGTSPDVVMVRAATGERAFAVEVDTFATSLAWASDGRSFAVGDADGRIRIYDRTGAIVRTMHDPTPPYALAFRGGDIVASAGRDGVVHLWHVATGDELERWNAGDEVYQLRFSPDGNRLLVMGLAAAAFVLDLHPWQGTPDELDRMVRCRVPFRIDHDRLVETRMDPAACPSPPP